MSQEENRGISKWIETTRQSFTGGAGGVAGAALGGIIVGPEGALVGGFVGNAAGPIIDTTFVQVAKFFKDRVMGQREEERVVNALTYAFDRYKAKLAEGAEVRQDEFVQRDASGRSGADEILEGVLTAAQHDHEEWKLKYYGNLIANLTFRSDIDRSMANQYLKLAQQLSFRQICILGLFAQGLKQWCAPHVHFPAKRKDDLPKKQTESFNHELLDLVQKSIIYKRQSAYEEKKIYNHIDIRANDLSLSNIGRSICELMELDQMSILEEGPFRDMLQKWRILNKVSKNSGLAK